MIDKANTEESIRQRVTGMKLHQYHDIWNRGGIEKITYLTADLDGITVEKRANVYVPFGYSRDRKYNVLYLIHGGGGNEDAWLDCSKIKNALDTAFAEDGVEPFLVVFPSFYDHAPVRTGRVDEGRERANVLHFQDQLRNELIPAVDAQYSTNTSREGRAIGGFSMGGVTTWFAFLNNLDLIATFLPLSGDCWQFGGLGGGKETVRTVDYLCQRVREQGYGKADFRIFAGTGYEDIAYHNLNPQIEEMKTRTDLFAFSENPEKGNLHYTLMKDAPHMYEKVYQHVYHYAPYIFG